MKVLIAAGGTGGHINPGIAIADLLKSMGHTVIFIGTKKGMEVDLVPKAGYRLKTITVSGLYRSLSLKNIKTFFELIQGINECKKIMKEEKPDLVIGTGGYVTAPVMIAAIKNKIPTMIHESNALPGKTTIWLSKKVDVVAVGFEEAKSRLPNARRVVCTGNPTKVQGNIDKKLAKEKLGINEKLLIVCGGSQGAKRLNEVMVSLINENRFKGYNVIYATGPKNYDDIISKIKNVPENVKVEKYIYNMNEVMSASDLMVARSGAMTVTEIEIVGIPSILIPFPKSAENHQYYNAKTLEGKGAAKIILESDLTGDTLIDNIEKIMKDDDIIKEMGQRAKSEGCSAIEKIREVINSIIK